MPEIETRLKEIDSADQARAQSARKHLLREVYRRIRAGEEAERESLAAALAVGLAEASAYSVSARNFLCRALGLLSAEAGIAPLNLASKNPETSSAACAALGMITNAKADAFLRAGTTAEKDDRRRLDFVSAVARQRGLGTGRYLENVAKKDTNETVRICALEGAAKFPIILADDTFSGIARDGTSRERVNAHRTRLRYAECLRISGFKHPSRTVLERIETSDAPMLQKKAARRLLARI